MAKNIEIKASLDDLMSTLEKAKSLSGNDAEVINQEDYFFNCDNGRLKLRFFSSTNGELIFYNRKNESGPKTSEYFITKTNNPNSLLQVLDKSYGICGIVKKTRNLFLIGRSRVHIDQVENLGDFLEFEVVLSDDEDINVGNNEAQSLISQFGIEDDKLIDCAYIDLLNKRIL